MPSQTTQKLIDAVVAHDHNKAQGAIADRADVNARIKQKNEPTKASTTLLNLVARSQPDDAEMAKILINAGADMSALDAQNNTPLLNAIAVGNIDFGHEYMQCLMAVHPDTDTRAKILDYKNPTCESSYTTLEFAIRRGLSELAISIIQAGANPNLACSKESPLYMACMRLGYASVKNPYAYAPLDLITTLLDHGADNAQSLFDYLAIDLHTSDEAGEVHTLIFERDIQLGIDSNRRNTYLSSELYQKTHKAILQQALSRWMKAQELPAEESKTPEASKRKPSELAGQGMFAQPTPEVTAEQKAKFTAACDKMIDVLLELKNAGKIDENTRLELSQKIKTLHEQPGNHQAFLNSMQQCEYLVGSKFLDYCMLAAGYAAKICSFGYYGDDWIQQANHKLEQIQVVADFEAAGEPIHPPSAR